MAELTREVSQEILNVWCEMRDALLELRDRQAPFPGQGIVITRPQSATDLRWSLLPLAANTPSQIVRENEDRLGLLVLNTGIANVFLDNSGLVNATSFPLLGGLWISADNFTGEIWAFCAVPTALGIIEMRV